MTTEKENKFLARFGSLNHVDHVLDGEGSIPVYDSILQRNDIDHSHILKILKNTDKLDSHHYIRGMALRHKKLDHDFIHSELNDPVVTKGSIGYISANPTLTPDHIDQIMNKGNVFSKTLLLTQHQLPTKHLDSIIGKYDAPHKQPFLHTLSDYIAQQHNLTPQHIEKIAKYSVPEDFAYRSDLTETAAKNYLDTAVRIHDEDAITRLAGNEHVPSRVFTDHMLKGSIPPESLSVLSSRKDLEPQHIEYMMHPDNFYSTYGSTIKKNIQNHPTYQEIGRREILK